MTRIELATLCVQGRCSSQLSYIPINTLKNKQYKSNLLFLLRKEVIQPHLPIRLPCYDFTPIIGPTLDGWLLIGYLTGFGCYQLSWCDGRCVQGPGTYSPQYADLRLLAIPTSRRRVAACDPNWDRVSGVCSASRLRFPLFPTIVVRV